MGFQTNGYVLRPGRIATGNARSTGEVTTGVSREHISPAEMALLGYDAVPSRPVEPYADMYRAAILLKAVSSEEEYLVFAATTGSLSTVESEAFLVEGDPSFVTPSLGTLTVGAFSDGTSTLFVEDAGGRDLDEILSLVLVRGDNANVVTATFASTDASTGRVVLSSGTLVSLGGGFSPGRGDSVQSSSYVLAAPKFWWTRNDTELTRFAWNGKLQRWAPLPGKTPQELGTVNTLGEVYRLGLPPTRFSIGDTLPGDPGTPDAYALLRAGASDASGVPLLVLTVADEDTEGAYPPSGAAFDAVLGSSNGALLLNPTWAETNAGSTLYYNAESFPSKASGDLGALIDFSKTSTVGYPCLSPIPGPTDRPFLRIGSRRYLTPEGKDSDADLDLPSAIPERTFQWSRTTGKVVLSLADLNKATPSEATYDLAYLTSRLYYDGIALSTQPVPFRTATPLVNQAGEDLVGEAVGGEGIPSGNGKVYVPLSSPLPPPGASGVLRVPDGTGVIPTTGTFSGTNVRPTNSGLVRKIEGVGDSFLFTGSSAFETLSTEEYDEDLPNLSFRVSSTEALAALQPAPTQPTGFSGASRAQIKRRGLVGEALYFLQAQVTPSVFAEDARIYSRFSGPFLLNGGEVLRFAIDGTVYIWTSTLAAGSYSATDVRASLLADTLPALNSARVSVVRERLVLSAAVLGTGSVEIGWNLDPDDLSGNSALGFLPGWRVDAVWDTFRWLPDTGASVGLYRSPENLNRSNAIPDIYAIGRVDETVTESIPGTPFVTINAPPLEDLPGFDAGVYFETVLGLNRVRLSNYGQTQGVGVKYEFENDRFVWTTEGEVPATGIPTPTDTLALAHPNVLPETFSSDAMGAGFGLYLKGVGATSYAELTLDEDFLLPGDGAQGQAILVSPEGGEITSGGGGTFAAASAVFSNPLLDPDPTVNAQLQDELYLLVAAGDLLEILSGDASGFYRVVDVTQPGGPGTTVELEVDPLFAFAGSAIPWRIYEGQPASVYDPTILADVQLVPFNPLPEEPFRIRLLSNAGIVDFPLVANVAEALERDRIVSLRFGLGHPPEIPSATLTFLQKGEILGVVAAEGIVVPISDPHFILSTAIEAYFQLRVGALTFSLGDANLALVLTFSPTIPAGKIEVGLFGSGVSGQVRFAADLLASLEAETLVYDQMFLNADLLQGGEAEADPLSGELQISTVDEALYSGATVYFVEQMVTEDSLDVTISPMNGSILFNRPLRAFQIVEAEYEPANTDGSSTGEEIVEFLPLIVRLEEATELSVTTYGINPTNRTIDPDVEPFIWVGSELQNYAGQVTAVLDPDSSVITFAAPVASGSVVKANYGVLEAFGGEQAYTVSTFPVYRPPFFLEKAQTTFVLETDRTDDIHVGDLFLVGPVPFYVKAVSFASDETTVEVWPSPLDEAGSRAPGKGSGLFVSSLPVAITVDPSDPIPGGGSEGFLLLVDTGATPILPGDRGQTSVLFVGNLLAFARTSHLLEIDGYPYLIVNSSLSSDGRFTEVSVSNPIYQGFDGSATVRISSRAIYPPSPVTFVGIAPFIRSEGYSLIRLKAGFPGELLREGVHYAVDSATGDVTFLLPNILPLAPDESLVSLYTALNPVGPIVVNGAVVTPFYRAKYLRITFPSEANRLLGSSLAARYTYRNPDSFYFQTLPLEDYLSTVARVALSRVSNSSRTGGPILGFGGTTSNETQGALGLRSSVRDLEDQDRAARAFIELYNNTVVAFEQILETIDGRVIGDRDGKFRFFLGHDKPYAPPGYEDEISGQLTPRLIWREIIDEWASETLLADGFYEERDPVFDPTTAEEKDPVDRPGETDGKTPNPQALAFFTALQRDRVLNDMDDRLLIGFGRPRGLALLLPGLNVPGLFRSMWEPSIYSRLYPERTRHFSRLFPGLEAVQDATGGFVTPGYFTPGRKVTVNGPNPGETTESTVKTRGSTIGVVANPALGPILGIVEVTAQNRLPRSRVFAYYPEGDATLDAALGISTVGKATFLATPLPLGTFPIDPSTGLPDPTQLLSGGGTLFDLVSGDPELSTPGFEVGQQVQYGTPEGPNGTVYFLSDANGDGIFVGEILEGCVITLADKDSNAVEGSEVYVLETKVLGEVISGNGGEGDTLFVSASVPNLDNIPAEGDSPTMEQLEELARALPDYRIQFDLKVGKRTGDFIDASLPTREDQFPLPLRNLFGQRPPEPLTAIEGVVEFVNTSRNPVRLPALLGEARDDSGDVQIPYVGSSNTEWDILGQVAAQFNVLLGSDSSVVLPFVPSGSDPVEEQTWAAIYPDEIVLLGEILETATTSPNRNPATLYASTDVRPVETAGAYVPDSAIGDLRPFDLLLVEVGQDAVTAGELYPGMTGILSVGDVSGFATNGTFSTIEPPRFVSSTRIGDLARYTITNAFGYLGNLFPRPAGPGIEVVEVAGGTFVLTLDLSSIGGVVLDDGSGGGTGGILALLGGGNVVVVNFYDPDPGAGSAYLGSILLVVAGAVGVVYTYDPSGPTASNTVLAGTGVTLVGSDVIRIEATTSTLSLLTLLSTATFYDYTITLDTYIDANTSLLLGGSPIGGGAGSTTFAIQRDRLTLSEEVSFASALPRNSTPANGEATELGVEIDVFEVQCATSGTTVNSAAEINGGTPLTIASRTGPDPNATVASGVSYVGTFDSATSTGRLRLMGWEGFGNAPLPFLSPSVSGVLLAGVPSSDLGPSAVIFDGSGTFRDSVDPSWTVDGTFEWIDSISTVSGAFASLQTGDLLVVDRGATGDGAVASGTYLVRHTIESNNVSLPLVPVLAGTFETDAGFRKVIDFSFPVVKSLSGTTLILSGTPPVPNSTTACGFASTGSVYLINQSQYATYDSGTTTYTILPEAVYVWAYSSVTYDAVSGEATFVLSGTPVDATGAAISAATFGIAATVGKRVSGMTLFPVNPSEGLGLPPSNVVGWDVDDIGTVLTAGVKCGIFGNLNPANHSGTTVTSALWDKVATPTSVERLLTDGASPTSGSLGVRVPAPEDNTEFYSDPSTVIYGRAYTGTAEDAIRGVFAHLSFAGFTPTNWENAHFDSGATIGANVLTCLLPFDRFVFGDDLDPALSVDGLWLLSGIFLEPSFPRPITDLALVDPHVVASSWPLTGQTSQVGHRNFSDFDTAPGVYEEAVHFSVRRIRRFHEVQATIASSLESLSYVYEIRKGIYGSYSSGDRKFTASMILYGASTNLGDFNDPKVNVNAGDVLRILDGEGNLLDSAEIQTVLSASVLKLRRPGLTRSLVDAATFQVYLRQPIVPHEQSNEQLLELVTDEEMFRRRVDYGLGDTDGGFVATSNELRDSLVSDWALEGVREGDYVVVDPAGTLYVSEETGARPLGDRAVFGRVPFLAGSPADLDDNRGFYRVTETPTGNSLTVDGSSRFGGSDPTGSDDVVYGDAGAEYAVLPTITASLLSGGTEGQAELRLTAPAVGGSFLDRTGASLRSSIQPFGYRILRPSSIFSQDALELVLFNRERILSWIEEIRAINTTGRGGDYYVFQRDDQIENVGSLTDPLDGSGIVSNALIASLEGLIGTTPFANVSDCLSVLDRRVWTLDGRLDASGYTDFVDDGFGQRPVLPDLVEDVLNLDDRFRELRYSWISFRADPVNGTIVAAKRAAVELPEELRKQQELIDQRRALEDE